MTRKNDPSLRRRLRLAAHVAIVFVTSVFAACGGGSSARPEPAPETPAPSSLQFSSVSVGNSHACGIATTGAAWCWGSNRAGQLGIGATGSSRSAPVAVVGGLKFVAVSAGSDRTCGLTAAGAAYCWGITVRDPPNNNAQLGDSVPVAIAGGHRFSMVSVGFTHACGVTTEGAAYCWGNTFRIGNSSQMSNAAPVAIPGGLRFISVNAANGFSCGITTDRTAYCWGDAFQGKLGNGATSGFNTTPAAVAGGLTFTILSSGLFRSCGITTRGATYCWGPGTGAVPPATSTQNYGPRPVPISGGPPFTTVGAGANHSCGLTAAGVAYCWGANGVGQLGDGTVNNSESPVAVAGDLRFASISVGASMTCGVTAAGAAHCWGANYYGSLGDGVAREFDPRPARVAAAGAAPRSATSGPIMPAPLSTATKLGNPVTDADFVLIRPGTFRMGDVVNGPVHTVTLTHAFLMQKTEVTQAQWTAEMGSNPSDFRNCGPTCPVDGVNFTDVQTFLGKLNSHSPGKQYRLPTEAEWEYAARAGTTGDFGISGDATLGGWIGDNSGGAPHPVGKLSPNAWGLYDMQGNVSEWVNDWFGPYPSGAVTDPTGPASGTFRVRRGGSWDLNDGHARSASRDSLTPARRDNNGGFRLAWSLPGTCGQSGSSPAIDPAVSGDAAYFEFQVEKPVSVLWAPQPPRYPDSLRSAKVQGEVLVSFVVDTTGGADMSTFKVIRSTDEQFTQAVRAALPTHCFRPAELGGRKVKQLVQQPFLFLVSP